MITERTETRVPYYQFVCIPEIIVGNKMMAGLVNQACIHVLKAEENKIQGTLTGWQWPLLWQCQKWTSMAASYR